MSKSRRRVQLADAHRIVVKLGTHVVTDDGVDLAPARIAAMVEGVARLRRTGREVVIVSSGAVTMGVRALGLKERPRSLGLRQACAAVGQSHLMGVYTQAFAKRGLTAAQVLLTQEDLADRDRALCVRTTLMRLLELGAVPVLNENDSVSVHELIEYRRANAASGPSATFDPVPKSEPALGFGDNDGLSARVAVSLDADLLVLLTNVDGLYTANPKSDPSATRIAELACASAGSPGRAWARSAPSRPPRPRASGTSPWARATAARSSSTTAPCARSTPRPHCCPSASSPSTATSSRATSSRCATAAGACTAAASSITRPTPAASSP